MLERTRRKSLRRASRRLLDPREQATTATRRFTATRSSSPRRETSGRSARQGARRAASPRGPGRSSMRRSLRTAGPSPSALRTKGRRTSTRSRSAEACRSDERGTAKASGRIRSAAPRSPAICPTGDSSSGPGATRPCPIRSSWPSTPRGTARILPLAQASEGAFAADGKTLFFTRLPRQASQTKRYQGGTAENLWRYDARAPRRYRSPPIGRERRTTRCFTMGGSTSSPIATA